MEEVLAPNAGNRRNQPAVPSTARRIGGTGPAGWTQRPAEPANRRLVQAGPARCKVWPIRHRKPLSRARSGRSAGQNRRAAWWGAARRRPRMSDTRRWWRRPSNHGVVKERVPRKDSASSTVCMRPPIADQLRVCCAGGPRRSRSRRSTPARKRATGYLVRGDLLTVTRSPQHDAQGACSGSAHRAA